MPFPAFAIPLAATALSTAYDWFTGQSQKRRAAELEKNNVRPDFIIPESAKKALASAEAQAGMTRLPGQSAIEGRLDRTTADQVAMVERLGVGGPTSINAASRAYSRQQDAETDLGIAAANMRLNNQEILRNELGDYANWENRKWDWEQGQPYLQRSAAIAALKEAGIRNERTAYRDLLGGLGNAAIGAGMDYGWFDNPAKTVSTQKANNPYMFTQEATPTSIDPVTGQQVLQKEPEIKTYTDKLANKWLWG